MGCAFLDRLDGVVHERALSGGPESYTYRLLSAGVDKVARKVGEEALELVLASLTEGKGRVLEEAADLIYHVTVLLRAHGLSLGDVCRLLEERHRKSQSREAQHR